MDRRIVGFHQDEEHHWVAQLECGHNQHVRHVPPWINRPWVITPEGRARMLGRMLPCRACEGERVPSLPSVASLIEKLKLDGIALPPGPVRVDGYGDSPALSESLLALIRSGRKRAGTGLLWAYEYDDQEIARTGDVEIVVDHLNQPALVTRITSATVVPYGEVTAEYAAIEGEGDGSLEYWRKAHWEFFSRECERIGREASESMPVVCSIFEVLDVVPPKGAS
jgi:uncharacterized protein YhfF